MSPHGEFKKPSAALPGLTGSFPQVLNQWLRPGLNSAHTQPEGFCTPESCQELPGNEHSLLQLGSGLSSCTSSHLYFRGHYRCGEDIQELWGEPLAFSIPFLRKASRDDLAGMAGEMVAVGSLPCLLAAGASAQQFPLAQLHCSAHTLPHLTDTSVGKVMG